MGRHAGRQRTVRNDGVANCEGPEELADGGGPFFRGPAAPHQPLVIKVEALLLPLGSFRRVDLGQRVPQPP